MFQKKPSKFGLMSWGLLGIPDRGERRERKARRPEGRRASPEFASLFSCLTLEQKELVLATMRELAKGK